MPVFLSRWAGTSLPWFHYWAPVYPFVIGGALAALGSTDRHRLVRPQVLVAAGALTMLLMSPLSPRAPDALRLSTVLHRDESLPGRRLGLVAPTDGSVVVISDRRVLVAAARTVH